MEGAGFERDGDAIALRGLYLDLPPWSYHVFELTASWTPWTLRAIGN
jgi:hypothetical protein